MFQFFQRVRVVTQVSLQHARIAFDDRQDIIKVMRDARSHERARLALEIYADRVRETVGALATTLGGIDALVFTAGVGENSASLRAAVCERLEFLGLRLDRRAYAIQARLCGR